MGDFFVEEQVVPAPGGGEADFFVEEAAPAAPVVQDNGHAGHESDFFTADATSAAAAEPVTPTKAPLDADDPRRVWARNNESVLQQRNASETKAKEEGLAKAKAYLDQVAAERTAQLSKRKTNNREAEALAGVAAGAVPQGDKPWERVMSVVNFNSEGASKDPFKELSRYKGVLLACKAKDIAVSS